MQASQTPLQKAETLLENGQFADFFQLLEAQGNMDGISDVQAFNRLKRELVVEGVKVDYSQRLKVFAQEALKGVPYPTQARFLTHFYSTHDFIGRAKDLEDLHQLLESNQPTVVVNGIGGIGKTALAKKYVVDYQHHYNHIAWINQQTTLLEAFITEPRLSKTLKFTNENEITRFEQIIQFLQNKPGKNLLVVDNYERIAEEAKHRLLTHFREIHFQHWHILFTSRQKVYAFQPLELNTLPEAEAIKLFEKHCPRKAFEQGALKQLLAMIDSHTLTIELLAKTYTNNLRLKNLQAVIAMLENKAIDDKLLQALIEVDNSPAQVKLYPYLLRIFSTESLTTEEEYLLKQFAVLPNQAIDGAQLLEWLDDQKNNFNGALQSLTQKGWLSSEDATHFEMHRLTQMLMQKALASAFTDNEALFKAILSELDEGKVEAHPLSKKYLLSYAESLLINIDFEANAVNKGDFQTKLANTYVYLGVYKWAEVLYIRVLTLHKVTLGESHSAYASALNNLAGLYRQQGKYEKATPLYQQALAIRKTALGEQHPEYAQSLNNLALLYNDQRDYEQAAPLYRQALTISKTALGELHPDYATSLNNLAALYDSQGDYEKAAPLYQQALTIRKATLGEMHPEYANSLNNLAELYRQQGKYNQTEPLHQQALVIRKATLGEQHPNYGTSLNNLALLYHQQGKYDQAEPLYQEALTIRKTALGEQHPNYATALNNLGTLYYALKDYPKAEALIGEAYTVFLKALGETHPHIKMSEEWLEIVKKKLNEGNGGGE